MEVSMSKTRRGKYTDNRICYISKCKGDMRLYLRRKGKLSCFSYLVRGKSFSFYRGKIRKKRRITKLFRFYRPIHHVVGVYISRCRCYHTDGGHAGEGCLLGVTCQIKHCNRDNI